MTISKAQAKKRMLDYLKQIEDNTFCHAEGCKRKYPHLAKWGYVGNPTNGTVYCMDHQHLLKEKVR